MKKILFLALLALGMSARGEITLLHTYGCTVTIQSLCKNTFGQKDSSRSIYIQKRKEAIRKIDSILKLTTYNGGAVKKIKRTAKRARLNFDTYIHTADLAHEFGYNTEDLVTIAKIASKAKFESKYFNELADLCMLQAGPEVTIFAEYLLRMSNPNEYFIEKTIMEKAIEVFKDYAHFKSMIEAKAANKIIIDGMLKAQ